jgi:GWxTD domain-containing protein
MAMVAMVTLAGCAGRSAQPADAAGAPEPEQARERTAPAPPADATQTYQKMGLLAQGGALPFVGRVSFVAGPTPDTTFVVLSVSFPSRALTFARSGDTYRGGYTVIGELLRGTVTVAHAEAQEAVTLGSFRETLRNDESVIYQEVMRVAPGAYDLALTLKDDGSTRSVSERRSITVPRLDVGSLSTPIPFYEVALRQRRDSLPRVLASPRATVAFGRDSIVPLYLEGYGTGSALPLRVSARGERGQEVWGDSVTLEQRGDIFSGVVNLPVATLGIGMVTLSAWAPGGRDTTRTPVFVSFGENLPVSSFDDMLNYLRLYAPVPVEALRGTPPEKRAAAWGEFLRTTDPDPSTAVHEGLQQYFLRIDLANVRFRDDGNPPWLTDRGMAFVALGDPEQVFEPNPTQSQSARNRVQVWVYRDLQLQLEFRDRTGTGRWELTPTSEGNFHAALRRLRAS